MYSLIKTTIKSIIPKEFLFKNELFFRSFYGFFYQGKNHKCNICLKDLEKFILLGNQDLMCPFCGSLSRNRRLWHLLNENKSLNGHVLHFSPSRNLYRLLKKSKAIKYYSTDFTNAFLADYRFDITNINQINNKFNTIICYHILEHIIDDTKAMTELYRILKNNGVAYIQTPFKDGHIYEDYNIVTEEERIIHFGQFDHVRIYSIEGLKNRLENIGFKVETKTFACNNDSFYYGFKSSETVLIVNKV